jgi:hypothetical protein
VVDLSRKEIDRALDDGADSSLGLLLDELKAFINAQPSTTSVGVGYMHNATVRIAQNLTTDHAAAANALRLPMGQQGANRGRAPVPNRFDGVR